MERQISLEATITQEFIGYSGQEYKVAQVAKSN